MHKIDDSKGVVILNKFDDIFATAMRDVMANAHRGKRIVPERMEVFQRVFDELASLTGNSPEMSLHPAFSSGSVSLTAEILDFKRDDLARLKEVLDSCDTLEFGSQNGFVKVSVTVAGLFAETE